MSMCGKRRLLAVFGLALVAAATVLMPGSASATVGGTSLAAPTNLRTTTVSFTWVTLAWDASSGSARYDARVDTPDGLTSTVTFQPTCSFGGLEAGRTYSVSVWAVDSAGNRSAPTTIQFTTLPRTGPPPSTPSNLRAVSDNGQLSSVAWDPSTHNFSVSYRIWSGENIVWSGYATSVTSWELIVLSCLDLGATYTFTVQAVGADNYLSDLSAPLRVTLPNAVPPHP